MTADLAESCAAITELLPVALALTRCPDTDGTTGGSGKPGSRPPGNATAMNAWLDVHAGVRHIELTLRIDAGLPARRRGSSGPNTVAAIVAIEALSSASVSDSAVAAAVRDLERLIRPIEQLPAVDTSEPWRRVSAVCPYCGFHMLRVAPRSGQVTCLRRGVCADSNGRHPVGTMDVSRLTGDAVVRWADGLVAP